VAINLERSELVYLKRMVDRKLLGCKRVLDDKEYLMETGKTRMVRRAKLAQQICTSILNKIEKELERLPPPEKLKFNEF